MAQDVEFSQLEKLCDDINDACRCFPTYKRETHEAIADALERNVMDNINTYLGDASGKVKGWQEAVVGSRGGYAAVHAKPRTFHNGYAVGYITNALENGHKIRKPSGRAKRYKPRIKVSKVDGYKFYADTRDNADDIALEIAEEKLDEYLGGFDLK